MSFNGSGTFNINSTGQPVVTGTVISSTAFNALTADLATGLSTAITKDGQTTPTNNIPMGTFRITGLGAGVAGTDAATVSQVQSATGTFLTASGTNTITASVSPSLTAYSAGQMFGFVAANTNTGATTINISSLGAKSIVTPLGALVANDLVSGYFYIIYYDGTNFQLLGVSNTLTSLTLSGTGVQLTSTSTGAWKMPVGTTGQRPTGASGLIRMNSTTSNPEWYDTTTSAWLQFSQPAGYSVNYLVVAGGGGGGFSYGGGAGAGGLLSSSATFSTGTAYTITVGAGGAGSTSGSATGTNGSNSVISNLAITAIGGGGGGSYTVAINGASGGSGGGGATTGVSGSATSGQGNVGGSGASGAGGGGGGAGAVGATATAGVGGAGGAGASNSISGSAVTYGGAGGGGSNGTGGAGGAGGGGAGSGSTNGFAGTANTGGGGGGGAATIGNGGNGGSGIVIIAYLGSQRGTGGTVTSSGGYTIHTFTSSSTYNA
jgi:hypothetical protein